MRRRLLDTNVLIRHWRQRTRGGLSNKSPRDASLWATQLMEFRQTRLTATPVVIEFLAGTRSTHELELARAYLGEFDVIDKGDIPKDDWEEARRIAQRVPPDGSPRHLGDCLLKAIAVRFSCDLDTKDKRFPRVTGRQ